MTEPVRPTNVEILAAWLATEKVNGVPNIYDFARRVLQLKEAIDAA